MYGSNHGVCVVFRKWPSVDLVYHSFKRSNSANASSRHLTTSSCVYQKSLPVVKPVFGTRGLPRDHHNITAYYVPFQYSLRVPRKPSIDPSSLVVGSCVVWSHGRLCLNSARHELAVGYSGQYMKRALIQIYVMQCDAMYLLSAESYASARICHRYRIFLLDEAMS